MNSWLQEKLSRPEKALGLFLIIVAAFFGDLVIYRSVLTERAMGDGPIFLRAAWAVRNGHDLYETTDHNGWHYNYPPILAITLWPLADPPPSQPRQGYLHITLSIAILYKINLLALALAVHVLANSLEATFPGIYFSGSRGWWYLRLIPLLVCIVSIGHTLARVQTNLIVLMWICFYFGGLLANRRFLAGFALAGAVCIKVYPAFLALQLLIKRDGKALAGLSVGLALYLVAIPCLVMGPAATQKSFESLAASVLGPALGFGADGTRATELIQITATDNQSLQAIFHSFAHPWVETRPGTVDGPIRAAAIGLGVTLLAILIGIMVRVKSPPWESPAHLLLVQAMIGLMLFLSPVSHSHYGVLLLPGLTVLLWLSWTDPTSISLQRLAWLFLVVFLAQTMAAAQVPSPIPGTGILRNFGVGTLGMAWLMAECTIIAARERPFPTPGVALAGPASGQMAA